MAIAHVKIGVNPSDFNGISVLIANVIAGLTFNPGDFPAPNPSLANLNADYNALTAAITAWGPVHNRGSHTDWLNLVAAADTARNDLLLEADYVNNLVDPLQPYATQVAFIVTSGFGVKNLPTPQGSLGQIQNFHRHMSDAIPDSDVCLKWKKPLGLTSPNNVKGYKIFKANLLGTFTQTFISTKTQFTDSPGLGQVFLYTVWAFNDAGLGVASPTLTIGTPTP